MIIVHKIKYIFSRFNEMYNLFINKGLHLKCIYFIDYCFSLVINGASIYDYFAYDFFHLRFNGRAKYITYRKFKKIQDRCNKWSDFNLLRDKSRFNEIFQDLLGRKSLNFEKATKQQFIDFCSSLQEIFIKESTSLQGKGINTYIVKNTDIPMLYEDLKKTGLNYLIEEEIVQHHELAEFHPSSVNTLRVTSVFDNSSNKVTIATACFRMGDKYSQVDNFSSGGIIANIDVKTGIIRTVGFNEDNEEFMRHPISHKQIIGYQIPYWEECKNFVCEAAKRLPTVRYVGWDIVLLEGGKFLIIEGNNDADFTTEQAYGQALWPLYDTLTENLTPVN